MPEPATQRPPPVWLLVAATSSGPLALNIFVPSMPRLPDHFGTDAATVQLTLSLFLLGVAVGQLVYGPLSDRFGRRPLLLAGMGLYSVAGIACALAPTIGLLIAGRVVQALGGCAGMVIARAIVRESWDWDRAVSVLALVTAGMAVAPMVGPLIGGFVDVLAGWRWVFAVLVVSGAAVWLSAYLALPETNRHRTPLPDPAALWAAYRSLLVRPVFLGYALVTAFTSAAFFSFLGGAPYAMMERLHRPPSEYGLYFVVLSLGYIAGNMVVSRLVARVGGDALIAAGVSCGLAGAGIMLGFLAAGIFTPATLFLPAVVLCFGNGLTMPPSMTAAVSVDARLAGTASGLVGFLQMGMGAVASSAVASIHAEEPLVMIGGMIGMNILAMAALLTARRSRRALA